MKQLLWRLFARKNHKCQWCKYMTCISNHSACYTCYKFDKFDEYKNMPVEEMRLRNIKYKDLERKRKE